MLLGTAAFRRRAAAPLRSVSYLDLAGINAASVAMSVGAAVANLAANPSYCITATVDVNRTLKVLAGASLIPVTPVPCHRRHPDPED